MIGIILLLGFCPLKIKITQFPNGSHLNTFLSHSLKAETKTITPT